MDPQPILEWFDAKESVSLVRNGPRARKSAAPEEDADTKSIRHLGTRLAQDRLSMKRRAIGKGSQGR
jgi:hypothetical protein